jgi:hypothetical protein
MIALKSQNASVEKTQDWRWSSTNGGVYFIQYKTGEDCQLCNIEYSSLLL